MATFIAGSVYVLGFVGVLVLSVGALAWFGEWFDRRVIQPWKAEQQGIGQREARDRLLSNSWWFSEDKATFDLLVALARDGQNIDQIRDTWRKARG